MFLCAEIFQELADQYGFSFDVEMAELDERGIGDRKGCPSELVLKLAHAKADSLTLRLTAKAEPRTEHLLITCDQVVVSREGKILEKPMNAEEVRC
jgi:predicted house-cleaning NTP pyrophosphatase (Maf/HAM1 superfamily)